MESSTSLQPEAVPDTFCSVDAARLRVGTTLRFPIYDNRDLLLLAEGQTITLTFLERIRNRSVSEVKVHASELARMHAGQPMGTETSAPEDRAPAACELETESSRQLDAKLSRAEL